MLYFSHFEIKEKQEKAIEVESISQKDFEQRLKQAFNKKTKQIVEIDQNLKSDQAPDGLNGEKIYYSSHNQRTDRNTRAAKVGKFKNVLNQGAPGGEKKTLSKLFELAPEEKEEKKREPSSTVTGRLRSPAAQGNGGNGESASEDYLEDVAIGAQTILNAKEYRFYGFYARIREKLIHHWHRRLRMEIQKLENEGRPIVNAKRRTQVRVFLSSSGDLQNYQLLGSSGLTELDRAATDAFKLASPFPHPPREMIGEDGLVPIRWDFVVVANDSSGVQFSVERTGYR